MEKIWETYGKNMGYIINMEMWGYLYDKSQIHLFEKIFLWEMDKHMGYMIDIWEDNMGSIWDK